MTEQHPGGVPDDFDAFHRPPAEPGLDQTMVFATVPPAGPEPGTPGLKQRMAGLGRTKLAVAGVVTAVLLGGGAWAAASAMASSSNGQPAAAGAPTTGATTHAKGGKAAKAAKPGKNARAEHLAITQLGTNTFTATDAKGAFITVTYGDNTKFGNKQHPLSPDQLAVGMTVTVMGERSGDTVTATSIAEPVKGKQAAKPSAPAASATSAAIVNG
jgi:hypothetical protein